jgi:hypothetical protein
MNNSEIESTGSVNIDSTKQNDSLDTVIYLMPCNSDISIQDIKQSQDFDLILYLMRSGLLIYVNVLKDEEEVEIYFHSAFRHPLTTDEISHMGSDNSNWLELISPIPWENWNYDWGWDLDS